MGLFNECFRSCTALDPEIRSNVSALRCLRYLAQTVPTVLKEGEQDAYDREVHSFVNEDTSKLPSSTLPIDKWWAQVGEMGFSHLAKVAGALLTCFHGPTVESSFSEMGNIVPTRRNRLAHKSFIASHQVKQFFKPDGSVNRFSRENVNHSPINLGGRLLRSMRSAYESRDKLLTTLPTKRQFVDDTVSHEKAAKRSHHEAENE